MKYALGIDIGGTHVDVVALDQHKSIIAKNKQLVTKNLHHSVMSAINGVLSQGLEPSNCSAIRSGSTMGVNAILELTNLYRVGVLRLAGHEPDLPPGYHLSKQQQRAMLAGVETIGGGYAYNQSAITSFSAKQALSAVERLVKKGAEALAIVGVFSPLYADQEITVKKAIEHSRFSQLPLTLSHQVGGLGYYERENNTIINSALQRVSTTHLMDLDNSIKTLGFSCAFQLIQNNGTVLQSEERASFPIKTLASGPTNSLVGACKLAQLADAIVIDIGGTSTEIGVIENGFPRYSTTGASIAGIPTNYMLPALKILPLGGGSIITSKNGQVHIGPESVGGALPQLARSFGGDKLTLYDIGLAAKEQGSDLQQEEHILKEVVQRITDVASQICTPRPYPLVFVGGGAACLPKNLLPEGHIKPHGFDVANAYGAALAEISANVDLTLDLSQDPENKLKNLERQVMAKAIKLGAQADRIRIIEKRLLPFYYLSGKLTRVIMTASG